MNYFEVSHLGAVQMFWLHFWESLTWPVSTYVQCLHIQRVLRGLPLMDCHWSDSFRKVTKLCRFHSGCQSVKEELLFSRVATLSRVSLCVVVMCGVVFSDLMSFPSDQFSHRPSQGSDQVPLKVWKFPASKCTLFKWQVEPLLVNMCVKEQTLWFWTLFGFLMSVRPTRSGTRSSFSSSVPCEDRNHKLHSCSLNYINSARTFSDCSLTWNQPEAWQHPENVLFKSRQIIF